MDHAEVLLIGARRGREDDRGLEVSARLNGRETGSELERELANSAQGTAVGRAGARGHRAVGDRQALRRGRRG
ncbi:hypothetical protein ACRAWF_02705 [Streptomyces sp. L7]